MWFIILFSLLPVLLPLAGCIEKSSSKPKTNQDASTGRSVKVSHSEATSRCDSRKGMESVVTEHSTRMSSNVSHSEKYDVSSKPEQTGKSESLARSVRSESASSVVTSKATKRESVEAEKASSVDVLDNFSVRSSTASQCRSMNFQPTSSKEFTHLNSCQSSQCEEVSRKSDKSNRYADENSQDSNYQSSKLARLLKYHQEKDSMRLRKRRVGKAPLRPRMKNHRGILPFQTMTLTDEQMLQKAVDPDEIPIIEINTARELTTTDDQ